MNENASEPELGTQEEVRSYRGHAAQGNYLSKVRTNAVSRAFDVSERSKQAENEARIQVRIA